MAIVVAGTIQGKAGKPGKAGKAGKTGPGQTKPRLGTTGKPAKPKQDFGACPDKTRPFRQDGKRSLDRYSPKTSLANRW